MNIGKNIKYLRQHKNVTQEHLAEHLGISYQAVSKWETETNTPDIALLPLIAQFFKVSMDTLFSTNISTVAEVFAEIADDDVLRVVQLKGKKVLKIDEQHPGAPSILLVFPENNEGRVNNVEVWGNLIVSAGIACSGNVTVHGQLDCGDINAFGTITCGNLHARDINSPKPINKFE